MNLHVAAAVAFFPLLASAPPIAHTVRWDVTNAHAVSHSLQSLPIADQKSISAILGQEPVNLRAQPVDTANGRITLVQGAGSDLCTAFGNCAFWVLGGEHQVLLKTSAQTIKLQLTSHNGKPDLITRLQGDGTVSDLKYWQFDGTAYTPSACAQMDYADPDGIPYEHPVVVPQTCYTP